MDQTSVIMALLVANLAIIGVAAFSMLRRGPARDERAVTPLSSSGSASATPASLDPIVGAGQGPVTYLSPTRANLADAIAYPSTSGPLTDTISDEADAKAPDTAPVEPVAAETDDGAPAEMTASRADHGELKAHEPAWDESLNGALVDPRTGFLTRRAWDEAVRNEDHRFARYRRPLTMVIFELDGLDALAARLGQEPADRLIVPVTTAMRSNARLADIMARLGHSLFVAILPETDEIAAINYIERVRTACDMWLAAGAVAVRLAIGWAQPPVGGSLGDALRLAHDRMDGDRRRQGGAARPVHEDHADEIRETMPTPSVAGPTGPERGQVAAAGLNPSVITSSGPGSTAARSTESTPSVRAQEFENILADFLEHPNAAGTNAAPHANHDDADT